MKKILLLTLVLMLFLSCIKKIERTYGPFTLEITHYATNDYLKQGRIYELYVTDDKGYEPYTWSIIGENYGSYFEGNSLHTGSRVNDTFSLTIQVKDKYDNIGQTTVDVVRLLIRGPRDVNQSMNTGEYYEYNALYSNGTVTWALQNNGGTSSTIAADPGDNTKGRLLLEWKHPDEYNMVIRASDNDYNTLFPVSCFLPYITITPPEPRLHKNRFLIRSKGESIELNANEYKVSVQWLSLPAGFGLFDSPTQPVTNFGSDGDVGHFSIEFADGNHNPASKKLDFISYMAYTLDEITHVSDFYIEKKGTNYEITDGGVYLNTGRAENSAYRSFLTFNIPTGIEEIFYVELKMSRYENEFVNPDHVVIVLGEHWLGLNPTIPNKFDSINDHESHPHVKELPKLENHRDPYVLVSSDDFPNMKTDIFNAQGKSYSFGIKYKRDDLVDETSSIIFYSSEATFDIERPKLMIWGIPTP